VLSVLLGFAAAATGYSEASPIFASGFTPDEAFEALAANRIAPGPSILSMDLVLNDCFTAITSSYGLAQPSGRRNQMLSQCRQIAEDITARAPSYSFAWLIDAMSAVELHDIGGFNDALDKSYLMGANEEWIAALRVDVGERQFDNLEPAARTHHERDLQLLAQSSRGIARLADRYALYPDFRERITPVIESLSPLGQRMFLNAVSSAYKSHEKS